MTTVPSTATTGSASMAKADPRSLFTGEVIAKIAVLTIAYCAFFYDFLWRQIQISLTDPDWSHALLIPVISIYFIYARQEKLTEVRYRTFWPGLVAVVAGMVGYIFFTIGPTYNHTLQGGCAVLTVFGIVLTLCGPASMKVFLLPIAYLLLGVKIGERLMFYATAKLKIFAAEGAWFLLNLTGVETERTGSMLTLVKNDGTEIPLDVAEACSGMRMIVAFLALGVAIAFISCRFWWQRVILIALAIPVAMVVNVFRVATLGWLSLYDVEMAGGDFHMLVGLVWLLPALALYLGIVWILNRIVITEPIREMTKEEAAH
jgi:exosortase